MKNISDEIKTYLAIESLYTKIQDFYQEYWGDDEEKWGEQKWTSETIYLIWKELNFWVTSLQKRWSERPGIKAYLKDMPF